MSDSDEPDPPTVIKLVPPSPPPVDAMSERGARPPEVKPHSPAGSPMDQLKDIETSDLRALVTKVITLRGDRKENLVWHWIAVEALQIADPHRQAPPLVRMAALVLLRDLAMEETRAFKPPPDALRLIEEAAEAEETDILRQAAEEAEAHRLRCVPLICALCGKKPAGKRGSLILGYTPPLRICETCVRRRSSQLCSVSGLRASVRAAKALEAACLRDSRRPPRPSGKR